MSFSLAPTFPISSFITSKNLLFGLPLFCFPGNSIFITLLPIYSWSLLMTCPYHLSLPSLIFIPNCSTLTVPLMYSFLILSFLVTPKANLKIFISATSIFSTCFFVTAAVSSPYTSGSQTFFVHGALQKLINTRGALMKPKFANFKFYQEIVFRSCSSFKMHKNVCIIRKILKNILCKQ